MALAREWRQRALRDEREVRGVTHELEGVVRHRFGSCRNEAPRPLPGDGSIGRFAAQHLSGW